MVDGSEPGGFVERRAEARTNRDQRAHRDTIFSFARAAEQHDEDTARHLVRIRRVVELIAGRLGLPESQAVGYDAMLHDVGKLGIPEAILKKPGRLTSEERRVMESHTTIGEGLLVGPESLARAARIARSHHECWDGTGHPDGLAGDRIPVEARITAAADVLDALVSDRCYKEPWSYEEAIEQVCALAGTRLDPAVVDALRRCHADGSLRVVLDGDDAVS